MDAGTPLVGRQDVLAYVAGVLARARSGFGGLVLLTGEPGIGKTRLAEEIARTAEGFAVHWTWCTAEQSSGSLRPWSLLLRGLTASTRVAEQVQASSPLRALLAGTSETTDPELGQALLASDLVDVVRLAAGEQPLLLVLDDLHDAQASTLRLLGELTGAVRTSPLVIVATTRDSAQEWSGREQLRGQLLGQAHRLSLSPFSLGDVQQLLGPAASTAQAQQLLDRTGGNALLVTEMARASDDLPASLRAMVTARTARLETATRDVLDAAAVLGARFRLDVLADTTSLELGELSKHVGLATAADLLRPDGPGSARFSHELLRDVVLAEIGPAQRQQWHERAGEALGALHQRGRDVPAAEVATHLLRAGPAHTQQAMTAAAEAAQQAAAMSAFDDAVRWYCQALELVTDSSARTELLLACALARRGCGDADQARADLLQACALAPTPELRAKAVLALGTGAAGFEVDALDGTQVQLLREVLGELPEQSLALRAQVLARLSVASSRVASEAELLALAEQAVSLARRSGDDLALAGALAALCDATAGPEHVRDRLVHADEIIALASSSAELELLGRRLRLLALLELGDRRAAEQEAVAYELRAAAVRHPLFLWYVPLWKGFWALAEGRYDDSRTLCEEAARVGAGSENAAILVLTQTWCRLELEHDGAGLMKLFVDNDLSSQIGTWATIAKSLVLTQQGQQAEALALFESVAALVLDLPRDSEWLASLAQACTVLEGSAHWLRPQLYEALLPFADLYVIEGIGAATRGQVHRFLAMVAPDPVIRSRHDAAADQGARRIGATALLRQRTSVPSEACWLLEGDTWALRWNGRETRVRDSKGMRDLATLLAAQGKELGALDLYGAEAVLEHDTGDLLDAAARDAYKRRLHELEQQESLTEREALEREALLDQLSAAYGLGGRIRRTGSSAERARSAVTARVRDTVKRISALDAELGRHLSRSVRTGTFCSYTPEQPVDWRLTP